jgi:hypothetical protein
MHSSEPKTFWEKDRREYRDTTTYATLVLLPDWNGLGGSGDSKNLLSAEDVLRKICEVMASMAKYFQDGQRADVLF